MRRIRKLYTSRVLPLVYDYSLSVTEMVGKLVKAVNDMADDVTDNTDDIETLQSDVSTLQDQTQMALNGVENLGNRIENVEEELENVPTDERIGELQAAINQNSADIVVLDSRVDILESQPDLSSEVHNNTSNISTLQGDVSDLNTAVQGKSTVSYTRDLSSGTKIGSISIDSVSTDIYAPTPTVIPGASGITYDNTQSGMTASNVQAAIDELDTDVSGKSTVSVTQDISTGSKIGTITIDGVSTDLYAPSATVIPPASGITYDNTTSGLQATDVQGAIDEINGDVSSLQTYVGNMSVNVTNTDTNGTRIGTVNVTNGSGSTNNYNIRIPYNVPLVGRHDRTVYDQPQSPYQQYDLPRGVFAGHLTGGSKDIYFFVPTTYDYSTAATGFGHNVFLSASGAIRGISGYVDASSFTISDYKYNYDGQQTFTKRFTVDCQRGGILFMLHNENGFKTTASTPATYPNNTPVSVYLTNFKLNDPY